MSWFGRKRKRRKNLRVPESLDGSIVGYVLGHQLDHMHSTSPPTRSRRQLTLISTAVRSVLSPVPSRHTSAVFAPEVENARELARRLHVCCSRRGHLYGKGRFQVNARERRKLEKKRRRIAKRLDRKNMPKGDGPVFRTSNVKYEVSEKVTAVRAGGVAAAHVLAKKVGVT